MRPEYTQIRLYLHPILTVDRDIFWPRHFITPRPQYSPNSTWRVTSPLDTTTRHTCRARRNERVEPVELVVSSVLSHAVRQTRHSQNVWARHVERVERRLKMREMKIRHQCERHENTRHESADNETARHEKARHENAGNENSGKVVFWFTSAWTVYTAAFNFKSSRCRYLMNRNSTPRVANSCRRTLSIWCRLRCLNRRRYGRAWMSKRLIAPRNTRIALVPCGHQRFCSKCANRVRDEGHRYPICRSDITIVLTLYWHAPNWTEQNCRTD